MNRTVVADGPSSLVLDEDVLRRTYGGHLLVVGEHSLLLDDAHHHDEATGVRAPSPRGRAALMFGPLTDPLAYAFFQRALVAAAIVGVVCSVVGCYVVLRGLAFMGDAVSHSAFPGWSRLPAQRPVLPRAVPWPRSATALLIGRISRRGNLRVDTVVGVLFAGMFALGVVPVQHDPRTTSAICSASCSATSSAISPVDLVAIAILAAIVLVIVHCSAQGAPVRHVRSARCRRVRVAGHGCSTTCSWR